MSVYISQRYFEVTGLTPEDVIGKTRATFVAARHEPEDPIEREAWRGHVQILAERRPFRDVAMDFVRGDGECLRFLSNGRPIFGGDGNFAGYRGTGFDVTLQRRAEQTNERLLDAIEHLSEGIALFDAEDRLVFCNEQYRQDAGVSREVLVPGISFETYLREGIARGAVTPAPEDPELWIARRMEQRRNPGDAREIVWCDKHFLAREERLSNGETILVVLDTTEQRQREEELNQARKMETIGQLTGGIAHDFNNMLAIIQGNIAFLDRKLADDSELKALTEPALRAVKRGASLTHRLLAFSRRQALDVRSVDVADLIEGMRDMLSRSLAETIEIVVVQGEDLWHSEIDPAQLEQAVINLAVNARDAMPGGGKLTIELANATFDDAQAAARAEVSPGRYVMVAVTDSGHGMNRETVEKIFDPFFTTKAVGKGTGLGLSMVYGFIKQSGGHVTVDSREGEGATFKLYLPRSLQAPEVIEAREPGEAGTTLGETVLVVEDDDDLRALVVTLLLDLGYRVLDAGSGPAAPQLLEREDHVDLLLTDVVLPEGMVGPELAAAVQVRIPGVKLIYMSGYAESAISQHIRRDQGVRLVQKPFDPMNLADEVRAAINA